MLGPLDETILSFVKGVQQFDTGSLILAWILNDRGLAI